MGHYSFLQSTHWALFLLGLTVESGLSANFVYTTNCLKETIYFWTFCWKPHDCDVLITYCVRTYCDAKLLWCINFVHFFLEHPVNVLAVRFFVATAERRKRAASGSYPRTQAPLATVYRGSNYYYHFCADRWSASWSDFACRQMGFQ